MENNLQNNELPQGQNEPLSKKLKITVDDETIAKYENAMDFYWKGNYNKALPEFETLAYHSNYPPAYVAMCAIWKSRKDDTIANELSKKCVICKDWFVKEAQTGDAKSQFELARYYYWVESPNHPEVFKLVKKAAELGYIAAQNTLALGYEKGKYLPMDMEKAYYWYNKAADQGFITAVCNIGLYHRDREEFDIAIPFFERAAEQGDLLAQNCLGYAYEKGEGVPQSMEKAVYWYQRAAEAGYGTAQGNLASCYESGEFLPKDLEKALYWYEQAAKQGIASAQYNLAWLYSQEAGAKENWQTAVHWLRKAAEQGHAGAQCYYGWCFSQGHGVSKDNKTAMEWYQKAADQDDDQAQYNLGLFYEQGRVIQDNALAAQWYQKSADHGNQNALNKLGLWYLEGKIVKKDPATGIKMITKAAQMDHTEAQFYLGSAYAEGKHGLPHSFHKAFFWTEKAASEGHSKAQNSLGEYYYYGHGVTHDFSKAVEWFQKSVANNQEAAKINLSRCFEFGEGVQQDFKKAAELLNGLNVQEREDRINTMIVPQKCTKTEIC